MFCLDEIDKMSMDFRGDPSAALLEVLDPEQNFAFNDHYLDLDYDLSEVFFITTANTLHSIPPPLRDRMEIIQLAGYTEFDKLNIARNFLIKKQSKANGISADNIAFSDEILLYIIRHYTKEAGVRNLEREIGSVCRKVAKEVVRNGPETRVELTEDHHPGISRDSQIPLRTRRGKRRDRPCDGACLDRIRGRHSRDRNRRSCPARAR